MRCSSKIFPIFILKNLAVDGHLSQDRVSLGGLIIEDYSFGEASSLAESFSKINFDGVLGEKFIFKDFKDSFKYYLTHTSVIRIKKYLFLLKI